MSAGVQGLILGADVPSQKVKALLRVPSLLFSLACFLNISCPHLPSSAGLDLSEEEQCTDVLWEPTQKDQCGGG